MKRLLIVLGLLLSVSMVQAFDRTKDWEQFPDRINGKLVPSPINQMVSEATNIMFSTCGVTPGRGNFLISASGSGHVYGVFVGSGTNLANSSFQLFDSVSSTQTSYDFEFPTNSIRALTPLIDAKSNGFYPVNVTVSSGITFMTSSPNGWAPCVGVYYSPY